MIRCSTAAPEQTKRLAAAVALAVVDGDLLVLVGDLGAGKTAFTQGFAAALGVADSVTSPTFTLANRYEGSVVLNHLDAYRVEDLSEAEHLALPELLDDGVTVIEWGDNILGALPSDRLEIRITLGFNDDDRDLELSCLGPTWVARRDALAVSLSQWGSKSC